MFLRCLNCEKVYHEDELVSVDGDSYEYFGITGRMSLKGCPHCHDDDLEEVKMCECGEHYIPLDEDLCEECKEEVADSFRDFCKALTAAERDYLFEELLEDEDYVKAI